MYRQKNPWIYYTNLAKLQSYIINLLVHIWARSCKNVSYVICEQQRCRSACASAQSDQHLCCSLLWQYDMYTCSIQCFKILANFCSWAGWFESDLFENHQRHVFAWFGSYLKVESWKILIFILGIYQADSVESDRTAPGRAFWSVSTLFAILSASFGHTTLR